MLAGLIDERRGEQFCWIKFAHGEPIKPGFAFARVAVQPRPAAVPLPDINAV